ncbi:MAG: FIST C-terminal domain-containing protein [Phycisphaeraceae bacterium]|nr:FIST C-terminal domain-containing protein [Phycisphaerales bacterium]MCB9859140.1 FIST C-terminal domain-containing protein [Phycisphaeraceae bacterium]
MLHSHETPLFGAGLSTNEYWYLAAKAATEQAVQPLRRSADIAFVFFTKDHVEYADKVAELVRKETGAANLLGVSCEGVIAGEREIERTCGLSVFLGTIPHCRVRLYSVHDMAHHDYASEDARRRVARVIGADEHLASSVIFVDPFTVPLLELLPAMNECRTKNSHNEPIGSLIGGVASAAEKRGDNRFILSSGIDTPRMFDGGGVGISFSHEPDQPHRFDLRTVVSQGCNPFGDPGIVTKVHKNLIVEIGGRPALQFMQDQIESLNESEREQLKRGLLIGRVIHEYKTRFGRDDFVIRNVIGADEESGAVAVQDFLRVGQTVQLHLRDAQSAHDDLQLLLDGQRLLGKPAGTLLLTCNGRGSRLFRTAGHDARTIYRAFDSLAPGPELAKAGEYVATQNSSRMALAGMFAAGEIGPIGNDSYLHGHTACALMFRGADDQDPSPVPQASHSRTS